VSTRIEVSVVLPVYNEVENLPVLWAEMRPPLDALRRRAEVVFVDDGSTDGSADLIRRLAREDGRVRLVRLAANAGLTAALVAGFQAARGEIIVTLDSDLQYDPREIPGLVGLLDRCDAALGYRAHRQDPWLKRLSSRIANRVRTAVLRDEVRDSACTFRAMRRMCLTAVAPYQGMHRFIPTLLRQAGFRVIEVEVRHRPRQHGVSKYGVSNRAVRAFMDLLAVRWMRSRRVVYRVVEDTEQDIERTA
jgi:glycosyltransferase involved in cell wall biosynthesis